jgi:DNA-binding SARP family transcriptional activator
VEILLLGRFQVLAFGARLGDEHIPGRKTAALLKLLALAPDHQLSRDAAVELLWPDLGPGGAAQLYKALHQLRKSLGPSAPGSETGAWLAATRSLVRLAPPEGLATDIAAFEGSARDALGSRRLEALEAAAVRYTGDLLPMDLHAPWAEAPRNQLRQLYIDVLLALAGEYRKRGDLAAAAQTWRTALQKDATLEAAHRGLMEVFARQGQRDRALKQYGVCLDVLADELGVAPSQETRGLYDRIERESLAAQSAAHLVPLQAPAPTPPLVNRATECRAIDSCLDELGAGRGSVLCIEGPGGIGKSRLVLELTTRARQRGYCVLAGSAYEMEGAIAYGPFIDVLRAALRESPTDRELLPAEIAGALSGGLPEAAPVPNADPRTAQTYLFAAIAEFLRRRAAAAPLVVVLENLHAADQASRELFHFLARRAREMPVLLAGTRRDEGAAPDKLLRSVGETLPVTVLPLGPLNEEDHHELLRQQGGDASPSRERSDEIFRLSEGNPLYALELHGHRARSTATIPPSLRANVLERLEALSPAARRLLTIAAVAGEDIAYPLLEALWAGADDTKEGGGLLDVLDELIAERLLHEHGVRYRFRHALHRNCVYESASQARRRALHAQIARSLVELGEREGELPVERVAFHYKLAGDARQAAHFLTLAGERAAAVYAHDDALRSYREALAMLEPARDAMVKRICANLHTLVGDANRAAGYLAESFASYERALPLVEGLPVNGAELTELHRKIALAAIFTADMQKAGTHLAQAWRHAPEDPRVHARLHVLRALHLWHFNRLEEAAQYAHRALELAQSAHAEVESAQACEILAMTYLPLGRWQEGLRYEKQRLRHGRWSPELVVATDAHLCLWEYHVHDDRMLERATVFMREVAAEAERLGDKRCVAICQYALGTIHLWKGDTASALHELDESLALHERVGSAAGMAYTLARRAVLHTLENAIDLGWRSVEEGIEQAERASVRDHCLQRLYGVGIWNRMQAKDTARVAELVAKAETLLAAGACPSCGLELYPWLALHYLEQDDAARAAQCAERLEGLAAKTGNPVGETAAAIVRCGAAHAQGDMPRYRDARLQATGLMQGGALKGSTSPMTYLFDRMAAAP